MMFYDTTEISFWYECLPIAGIIGISFLIYFNKFDPLDVLIKEKLRYVFLKIKLLLLKCRP